MRAGDNRAAAGSMQAINVSTPPTVPIVPPPIPIEVAVEIEPVEFDETSTIFSNPADERTEAYVTGRFG